MKKHQIKINVAIFPRKSKVPQLGPFDEDIFYEKTSAA